MRTDATAEPAPAELAAVQVQRWRTLADRIANDVLAGSLAPGAWLKQIDLEHRYGFNRGDVRRALDELVARRVVQHVPNRGHHVFDLEPDRVANLVELRAILEGAIADLIHDRADAVTLRNLSDLARKFESAVQNDTPLAQHAANIAFHMALVDLCPNVELAQMARDVRKRLPSALLYQWRTAGWIEQSIRDHAMMLVALRRRDRTALRRAVVGHLRKEQRTIIACRANSTE